MREFRIEMNGPEIRIERNEAQYLVATASAFVAGLLLYPTLRANLSAGNKFATALIMLLFLYFALNFPFRKRKFEVNINKGLFRFYEFGWLGPRKIEGFINKIKCIKLSTITQYNGSERGKAIYAHVCSIHSGNKAFHIYSAGRRSDALKLAKVLSEKMNCKIVDLSEQVEGYSDPVDILTSRWR